MKKLIALMLALLMLGLSLTSCIRENTKDEPELYTWGNEGLGWPRYQDLNALLTSETKEFDLYDVTLDFYYCFYCLDDETLEESRQKNTGSLEYEDSYAIYISNGSLDFERGEHYSIVDYENKVNAKLYKYITSDESYETNYGYTTYGNYINYNYVEKLTIPVEYFLSSKNRIHIYVVSFFKNLETDTMYLDVQQTSIDVSFELLDNNRVVLIEN